MNETQYTLVKLPFRELMDQNYDVRLDRETEISKGYLAAQGNSLLIDQIERLAGNRLFISKKWSSFLPGKIPDRKRRYGIC